MNFKPITPRNAAAPFAGKTLIHPPCTFPNEQMRCIQFHHLPPPASLPSSKVYTTYLPKASTPHSQSCRQNNALGPAPRLFQLFPSTPGRLSPWAKLCRALALTLACVICCSFFHRCTELLLAHQLPLFFDPAQANHADTTHHCQVATTYLAFDLAPIQIIFNRFGRPEKGCQRSPCTLSIPYCSTAPLCRHVSLRARMSIFPNINSLKGW